jgi:hypothetical protein
MAIPIVQSIDLNDFQILNFVVHSSASAPVNVGNEGGMMWWKSDTYDLRVYNDSDLAWNSLVQGPATSTDLNIPIWDGVEGNKLADGLGLVTTVGNPGSDTNLVSESGIAAALLWERTGTVLSPINVGDSINVDAINEQTTNLGVTIGSTLTVDQTNGRVGIGNPIPSYELDVAGTIRAVDSTIGQSTIGYGLVVNSLTSPLSIADFQVNTLNYAALYTNSSDNSLLIMNSPLGKVGFFGETPTTQSTGWSVTNHILDKVYDANATTINEICDILGELITELKTKGILG